MTTVSHHPPKVPLVEGTSPAGARIDGEGRAQRPRQALEASLRNVVIVLTRTTPRRAR